MVEENRRFNRVDASEPGTAVVTCAGLREQVRVHDMSAGGMKIIFSRPINVGAEVYGKFNVLPNLGPFYVRGKVIRTLDTGQSWESAVEFDKVSTIPLDS